MVSFSMTNANAEKINKAVKKDLKDLITISASESEYTFAKFALDNDGKVFIIFCEKSSESEENKNEFTRCKLTAFSVDEDGKNITLGIMRGHLSETDTSYCDRIDSFYERKGIGREVILFWEEIVHEYSRSEYIDLIAINGEKTIPWYESLGYHVVEYFGAEYKTNPESDKPEVVSADAAFMTKELTVRDYAVCKAFQQSKKILDSAPENVKKFVSESNAEISEFLSTQNIKPKLKK